MMTETKRTLGPFTLLDVLGEGGMGRVYRARQTGLDRDVALKVVSPGQACDPEAIKRFQREAQVLSRLTHPNVVRIFDAGVEDDILWISMELLEGRTLVDLLKERERLPALESVAIVRDVCRGLVPIHERGLIHRDLKPANVMIANDGSIKIMDLGLAKDTARTAITEQGSLPGTPAFIAPEMITGQPYDHRVDVYQAGVILYLMVAGRLPHETRSLPSYLEHVTTVAASPPSAFNADISKALDELILRAISIRPERRPSSAQVFAEQLDRLLVEGSMARKRPIHERRTTDRSRARPKPASQTLPLPPPTPEREREREDSLSGVENERRASRGWLVMTGALVGMACIAAWQLVPQRAEPLSGPRLVGGRGGGKASGYGSAHIGQGSASSSPAASPPASPPAPSASSGASSPHPGPPPSPTLFGALPGEPPLTAPQIAAIVREFTRLLAAATTPDTFRRIREEARAVAAEKQPAAVRALVERERARIAAEWTAGPLAAAIAKYWPVAAYLPSIHELSPAERSALLMAAADATLLKRFLIEGLGGDWPIPDIHAPGLCALDPAKGLNLPVPIDLEPLIALDLPAVRRVGAPKARLIAARSRIPVAEPAVFNEVEFDFTGGGSRADLRVERLPARTAARRTTLQFQLHGGAPTARLVVRLGRADGGLTGSEAAVLFAPGKDRTIEASAELDDRLLADPAAGLTIHYEHQSVLFGSDPIALERLVIYGQEKPR